MALGWVNVHRRKRPGHLARDGAIDPCVEASIHGGFARLRCGQVVVNAFQWTARRGYCVRDAKSPPVLLVSVLVSVGF
jgi:hypothetical protein